jgi:hypothetical protein
VEITASIHTYLTTAAGSHFLGQEVTMLAQWEGHDNLLWRVNCRGVDAVVKLFLDAGQARGRRQFDGQERFARLGLAPRPLWFDRYPTGLSRQLLVYVWTPGEQLVLADGAASGAAPRAVAQLHQGDPSEVRRFCPQPVNLDYFWRIERGDLPALQAWLNQHAAGLGQVFAQLADQAGRLVLAALPLWQGVAPTPVHGDLRPEHWIENFGEVVLLDWELFGLGDPALDVASFLYNSQGELDEAAQEQWLAQYLGHFDQPGLAQRIDVYRRLLSFQALCFLLRGLRDFRAQPGEGQALAETEAFLAETLGAAFQQSAHRLGLALDHTDFSPAINQLFAP